MTKTSAPCPPTGRRPPAAGSARTVLLPLLLLGSLCIPVAAVGGAAPAPASPPAAAPGPAGGVPPACEEGLRLYRAQQLDRAGESLQECLRQGGDHPEPLLLLTMIALRQDRAADAVGWGRRAVAADSASADTRYWYGRALLADGKPDAAQRQWEAGLALDTSHPGLLEALARLSMDRGHNERAYNLLHQLGRSGVDEPWLHRLMSDLASRKGMWDAALQQWQLVVAGEGESEDNLLRACELGILSGDTATALTACERAVELGHSAAAYGSLGEALFAADRQTEALAALRRAVVLAPDEPRYRFNLANLLEVLGRADEADEHFSRFVNLQPDDPIGRLNYGIHLDRMGRTGEALTQIEAALDLAPDLAAAQLVRGQLLEKQERYEDALAVVDELLAAGPEPENVDRLEQWRQRLRTLLQERDQARTEGACKLLHIVAPDTQTVRLVRQDLAAGLDFAVVATRYSVGPTAARGGDIGWVVPQEMVEPLRSAIEALGEGEVSRPIESRGLWHFFKRVR